MNFWNLVSFEIGIFRTENFELGIFRNGNFSNWEGLETKGLILETILKN